MSVHEGSTGVGGVDRVLRQMQQRLDVLPPELSARGIFLGTYGRTTAAVGAAIAAGNFDDPGWVEEWDVVFARLYFDAFDADLAGVASAAVPRPWRLAFAAPDGLPPLRHVLLGVNAHINYDLPQALLEVIPPEDFDDPVLMASRHRDHERIDDVLAVQVSAEDALVHERSLVDRLFAPVNRAAARRFLAEARRKVWLNTEALHDARVASPDVYRARLAELELLSAAKIADLLEPGQVVLRLAVAGFGVTLPPP